MAKVIPIKSKASADQALENGGLAQREMLVVMTALVFIEQHALLTVSQLNDAKRSIQALFIRTSGEELMLRKLIEILRLNKELRDAFSSISKISTRISSSVEIISRKANYLRQYVSRLNLTPEESANFFAPFLSFTHQFVEKIRMFNKEMEAYLDVKETEARRQHEFRIAQEASERLRQRLSGKLTADVRGEVESTMKQEILETFDHAEAKTNLTDAQRNSRIKSGEIQEMLAEIKCMCEMAKNPEMRDDTDGSMKCDDYDDVFSRFMVALRKFPRLRKLRDFLLDYFKLYQRAFGMFALDFNNFNIAAETIARNPDEYFDAKQEDEDIRVKLEKLKKIEGLIPFLESTASVMSEEDTSKQNFQQFSRNISRVISENPSKWQHISEDLLVAKVSAEAELSTRI